MEKRKEERKKEVEQRRLEREREKLTKQSSPKRLIDLVVPDVDSDHEEFEPWEDLDEAQSSPRSDVTVSGMARFRRHFKCSLKKQLHSCNITLEYATVTHCVSSLRNPMKWNITKC